MTAGKGLLFALAVALGLLLGLGGFTFRYAEGLSYLSTDPEACTNCHIMQSQYDSWQKASHHTAAVCVDCHLPPGFVSKYLAKAENGYHHSKGFTLQDFHEPIMMKPRSAAALQANCLRCHGDITHAMQTDTDGAVQCVHCHRAAGHGDTVGMGGMGETITTERTEP